MRTGMKKCTMVIAVLTTLALSFTPLYAGGHLNTLPGFRSINPMPMPRINPMPKMNPMPKTKPIPKYYYPTPWFNPKTRDWHYETPSPPPPRPWL